LLPEVVVRATVAMLRDALEFFVGKRDPNGGGVGWWLGGAERTEGRFVTERRASGIIFVVRNSGAFVVCWTVVGASTRRCVLVQDDRWMGWFAGDEFVWRRSFEGA
jgi:hypothetical protein